MSTYIYMVRHGESPKLEGNERMRGLTERGHMDARRVTDILKAERLILLFPVLIIGYANDRGVAISMKRNSSI